MADIAQFEPDLYDLLQAREQGMVYPGYSADTVYGKGVGWINLLFAVLAAGCQNSEMPRAERELSSRVLGRSLPRPSE